MDEKLAAFLAPEKLEQLAVTRTIWPLNDPGGKEATWIILFGRFSLSLTATTLKGKKTGKGFVY